MSWTERVVFHPLLLCLYPILAFLGVNLGQVKPGIANRAIVGSILLCVLVWAVTWVLLRDLRRAGLGEQAGGVCSATSDAARAA